MRTPYLLRAALVLLALVLPACGGGSSSPSEPPQTGPLDYVALGASDAVGVGASPLSEGYVFKIEDLLRAARGAVDLTNLGIPSAETDTILGFALAGALAAEPEIVTLWTGSNDLIGGTSPDEFAANLDELLSELRAGTSAQIFVGDLVDLTVLPRFRANPDPDVTRARVDAFNARIVNIAANRGAVLVRLSAIPLDDSLFSADGFHPSNAGHRLIADTYWAEISPRL